MIHIFMKIIEIRNKAIFNNNNKPSLSNQDIIKASQKALKIMKTDIKSKKDTNALFKIIDEFQDIEKMAVLNDDKDLHTIYTIAKKEIFEKYKKTLSDEALEIIGQNQAFFDQQLERRPKDNHPLGVSDLNFLADQLKKTKNKDTDIYILRSEILHAVFVAYHPDNAIKHSLKMMTELVPMAINILGYKNDFKTIKLLLLGTLLHDIGKLTLPLDIVLNNPKSPKEMTDEEYISFLDFQYKHTINGEIILKNFCMKKFVNIKLIKQIKEAALKHHEKINGKGYHQFKHGQIPINVQIISILDIFNALTEKRIYKEKISKIQAIDILEKAIEKGEFDIKLMKLIKSMKKMYS